MDNTEFKAKIVPLYRRMFSVAAAMLENSDDAADAVQNAMVGLWNNRNSLDKLDSIEAYAFTCLKRSAIDIIRKRSTANQCQIDAVADPPVAAKDIGDIEIINRIIETLPQGQKTVVKLSSFEDKTIEEIATITGYSQANVRQLLSRGRHKIKELYIKLTS